MVEKYLGILDEEDGIRQEIWYEEHTDKIHIRDIQDVQPILEQNRRERNANHGTKFGDFKRIAVIPGIVVNDLMKQGIWYDKKRFRKWLNQSEFKNMRTMEGRL